MSFICLYGPNGAVISINNIYASHLVYSTSDNRPSSIYNRTGVFTTMNSSNVNFNYMGTVSYILIDIGTTTAIDNIVIRHSTAADSTTFVGTIIQLIEDTVGDNKNIKYSYTVGTAETNRTILTSDFTPITSGSVTINKYLSNIENMYIFSNETVAAGGYLPSTPIADYLSTGLFSNTSTLNKYYLVGDCMGYVPGAPNSFGIINPGTGQSYYLTFDVREAYAITKNSYTVTPGVQYTFTASVANRTCPRILPTVLEVLDSNNVSIHRVIIDVTACGTTPPFGIISTTFTPSSSVTSIKLKIGKLVNNPFNGNVAQLFIAFINLM